MKIPTGRVLWSLGFAVALAASFSLGRWSGALKGSLEREASYPWALHNKLSGIDAQCERLRTPPTIGKFFVQSIDDGETLLVAVSNEKAGTVEAFAVNSAGQVASDSWPLQCK